MLLLLILLLLLLEGAKVEGAGRFGGVSPGICVFKPICCCFFLIFFYEYFHYFLRAFRTSICYCCWFWLLLLITIFILHFIIRCSALMASHSSSQAHTHRHTLSSRSPRDMHTYTHTDTLALNTHAHTHEVFFAFSAFSSSSWLKFVCVFYLISKKFKRDFLLFVWRRNFWIFRKYRDTHAHSQVILI